MRPFIVSSSRRSPGLARRLRILSLAAAIGLMSLRGGAQIGTDGNMEDWEDVPALQAPGADLPHATSYGIIESLKAACDPEFLFVQIVFEKPRPFVKPALPERLADGVWDDFNYLELDVNGDGRWDWRAQMSAGKRPGLNNLAIVGSDGQDNPRAIQLWPEGNKNYSPRGPRACFSKDCRAVEMRIPRVPLRLDGQGTIQLRGRVRYRDKLHGSDRWVEEFYPDGKRWIDFTFGPNLEPGDSPRPLAGGGMVFAPVPRREGAVVRDEEDVIATTLTSKDGEPGYNYPMLYNQTRDIVLRKKAMPRPTAEERAEAMEPGIEAALERVEQTKRAHREAPPEVTPAVRGISTELPAESAPATTTLPQAPEPPAVRLPEPATPTPIPAQTPSPSPVLTPSPTPGPAAVPTPTPTPSPSPAPMGPPRTALDAPIAQAASETLCVDGDLADWTGAQFVHPLPPQAKIRASDPVGILNQLWLNGSRDFLYVRLDFEKPRPLASAESGAPLAVEDSGAYLRLDVDGDGRWDFEVQAQPGPKLGVLRCVVANTAGDIVLRSPLDSGGRADGPIASLANQSRTVEMRLPRAPLGLTGTARLRMQAIVRYRTDGVTWRQINYPSLSGWFVCDLDEAEATSSAGGASSSIKH